MTQPTDLREPLEKVARMFKALGDPTRLRIFAFLRSSCCTVALDDAGGIRPVNGPTVGEVCCHVTGLGKITSTLSYHLQELREAGLVEVEKRGRCIVCHVNAAAVAELDRFLDRPSSKPEDEEENQ